MSKQKPTYEQALGLQRGQNAARANRRRAQQADTRTPDERVADKERYGAALAAYRAQKGRRA